MGLVGLAPAPQKRAKPDCKEKILTLQKIQTKGTDVAVGQGRRGWGDSSLLRLDPQREYATCRRQSTAEDLPKVMKGELCS